MALKLERLDDRCVPAANVFLQGTSFVDANGNGVLDTNESYLGGATVTLFKKGDPTALAVTTTDATTGYYKFDDSNVAGGLAAGTYELVETPPPGYRNQSAQVLSQINPASVLDSKTIEVTVIDPSSLQVTFNSDEFFARNKWAFLSYTFFGTPDSDTVGQFPITVTGNGLGPQGAQFLSLCIDLFHGLTAGTQTFSVYPSPLPGAGADPASAGRIGYLFNHYGTQDLSLEDGVGLQLAIWQLEYGANFNNVASLSPTTAEQLAAAQARANFYLADSVGKSEAVTFLLLVNVGPPDGQQGMLATSTYNFGNTLKVGPSIATIPGGTVVIGSGARLSDVAVVTGGVNPTGAITFVLYSPTSTVVHSETVTVSGNGSYTTSIGYLPTEVGTYQWVASYGGDGNNLAVSGAIGDEPQAVIKASPMIVTNASASGNSVVGSALIGDTATLSGGYLATGTITFRLTAPDGATTTVGSVAVSGDGTYQVPTMVLATQVGIYTWQATYNGDSRNNLVIDNGQNESVTIIKASPIVRTVASVTAGGIVNVGMLSDTATLTGGYLTTGTITFRLTAPDGTTMTVGSVAVTGDGTYQVPTMVLATQVGTYTWQATYSGDGRNNLAIDNGVNESVQTGNVSPDGDVVVTKRNYLASFRPAAAAATSTTAVGNRRRFTASFRNDAVAFARVASANTPRHHEPLTAKLPADQGSAVGLTLTPRRRR